MTASPEDSTDTSLLRRVQAQDQVAWHRLVGWAGPLVYFWCRRAGLSAEDQQDVFQDVFLAVAANVASFQGDCPGASFRGWLLTITHRKIIDLARRHLHQPRAAGGTDAYQRLLQVTEGDLSSLAPSDPDSRQHQLRRALEFLCGEFEEKTWRAFWRTAVDGLRAPAAAAELGLSPAAVRKAKSRVLARLRQEFAGLLD